MTAAETTAEAEASAARSGRDERPVALTAHPLQRVGAFALAALAGAEHPDAMTKEQFEQAAAVMASDVIATADVEESKSEGGFWLGVSHLMWPNSAMNPTARKKLTRAERQERIRAWRTYRSSLLAVPCALCGREACGFFGKVDVPLGMSTEHRNSTAPGHEGLALCAGCLASFHALPYGCQIGGGRACALHSWDDSFLRRTVAMQVGRTRRQAAVSPGMGSVKTLPYAREITALRWLRSYEQRLRAGVELHVFSNSNREQSLDVHSLEQPLAEWLRTSMLSAPISEGFRYLVRAHWTEKVPGLALLARNSFREPGRILARAAGYLAGLAGDYGAPAAETPALGAVCFSFAMEVLQMQERDVDRIKELAGRIAGLIAAEPEPGRLKRYEAVQRDPRQLQAYLKREAVDWVLRAGQSQPLVTDEQWRLLFEPDGPGWLHRDLLFVGVLQNLAERGWSPGDSPAGDPAVRAGRDDTLITDGEDL